MKMRYLLFICLFSFISLSAQQAKLASAEKKYNSLAYIDAIEIYERVAEKGHESTDLFQKLGNSYYFNGNLKEAGKWYEKLFGLGQEVEVEYYYRYAQCLKAVENYTKANDYLSKFSEKTKTDNRSVIYNENKNYLSDIKKISNRYTIENAEINSEFSDYGSALYKDQLIFASARDTGSVSNVKSKWTNQSFTNLYSAKIDSEGNLNTPEEFSRKVNSKLNESTPVFSKDGKTMYFTRNNFNNGKKRTDSDKKVLLKLYKATLEGDNWKNIEELPFNSDEYSVAHPALSPDNKTLYFASDMPGTKGQSDLFKVAIKSDGSFGTPENLGSKINTEARETFPFVDNDGILYFASDGQLGLGGLDIFAVKMYDDGSYSRVLNLGTPVNGSSDDFAYLIDSRSRVGFFSSNRAEGKGYDDIYKFKENTPLEFDCRQAITGFVSDEETSEIISKANIRLFDANMQQLSQILVDKDGRYRFEGLDCNKVYHVRAEVPEYETSEVSVTTDKISGETLATLEVSKRMKEVAVGKDLGKVFGIKIIYFDLNKANIRKDAALELEKIVEVMKENPSIKVDVRSHTDSRQSAEYNEKLSDKRAKATVAWMVKKGISADRLTGKGYGESQLVNKCSDGVECSEEEHQANRRSEFIVIEM